MTLPSYTILRDAYDLAGITSPTDTIRQRMADLDGQASLSTQQVDILSEAIQKIARHILANNLAMCIIKDAIQFAESSENHDTTKKKTQVDSRIIHTKLKDALMLGEIQHEAREKIEKIESIFNVFVYFVEKNTLDDCSAILASYAQNNAVNYKNADYVPFQWMHTVVKYDLDKKPMR